MSSANNSRGGRVSPACSAVLEDGTLVELVFRRDTRTTGFVTYRAGDVDEVSVIELPNGAGRLVPFSPRNNLLAHDVVLLPSAPRVYPSEEGLLGEVREFIHRYADVSSSFEEIASYYVLFSWVYDVFRELPYLRVRGDFGSGKSRVLQTIGSICYKPIFSSGASTVSPLFRILDAFRGTLILDESDFRFSDERAEIVKILNNGNGTGFPVLRSEAMPNKEYNPRAFHVFGPKIIASRGLFTDRALESRCITEEMGRQFPRADIPLNLPTSFAAEAQELRDKLLMFRFQNRDKPHDLPVVRDVTIEPRIAQIFSPLLATIESTAARERMLVLARRYSAVLAADRSMTIEAQLLEAIHALWTVSRALVVKDIAEVFAEKFGNEYRRPVTPRWIGTLLRSRLSLVPSKSHGIFTIPASDEWKLKLLFEKYRVGDLGDVGDVGDVESRVNKETAA